MKNDLFTYGSTKLLLLMACKEMVQRLEGSGVTCLTAWPGIAGPCSHHCSNDAAFDAVGPHMHSQIQFACLTQSVSLADPHTESCEPSTSSCHVDAMLLWIACMMISSSWSLGRALMACWRSVSVTRAAALYWL